MGIALIWSLITVLVRWILSKVGFGGFPSWLSFYYTITLDKCLSVFRAKTNSGNSPKLFVLIVKWIKLRYRL